MLYYFWFNIQKSQKTVAFPTEDLFYLVLEIVIKLAENDGFTRTEDLFFSFLGDQPQRKDIAPKNSVLATRLK